MKHNDETKVTDIDNTRKQDKAQQNTINADKTEHKISDN